MDMHSVHAWLTGKPLHTSPTSTASRKRPYSSSASLSQRSLYLARLARI
jgi:hypothetical protein